MSSDNYYFERSNLQEGSQLASPYIKKEWQFVNDINGGSYVNSSQSTVQFDLTSIFNSTKLVNLNEAYFLIPVTYVSVYTTGTAGSLVAPVASSINAVGGKPGAWNLINGADCQWSGKNLQQYQQNINAYISYKMLSDLSATDIAQLGPTLNLGNCIDGWESSKFNGSANATFTGTYPTNPVVTGGIGGNGISNNAPFALSGNSNAGDQAASGAQFVSAYNKGLASRLSRIADTTNSNQNMIGSSGGTSTTYITNSTNLLKEFRPYYTVLNTNYMVVYDLAIVKVGDLFNSFKTICMTKRMMCTMRLYMNTGTVASALVSNGSGVSTGLMTTSLSSNTFIGTCPIVQSALLTLPNTCSGIVTGVFIGASVPNTAISFNGGTINLANSQASHFLNSVRFVYPNIELKTNKLIPYLSENRSKKICFVDVLSNQINNIGAGATYSALIQSGVQKIKSVILIPMISSTVHGTTGSTGTGVVPFSPLLSPFCNFPSGDTGPISLINLQVQIGGVNILSNVLSAPVDNYLQEILLYNNINGAETGVSCGLINQDMWTNNYRVYHVSCDRCNLTDLATPRNIVVSFVNNSLQPIDVLVFTEKYVDFILDVETGQIEI